MAKIATSSTPAAKPSVKASASVKPAPKRAVAAKIEEVAPAPPAKAAVVTLKQLALQFGDSHDMPAKEAQAMLDSVVGLIVDHLKVGDKLRLTGLGILEVKDRPARAGRNPANRRGGADCRQQEDRIPAGQGAQGGYLTRKGKALAGNTRGR